jgi:hypothetical protein
MMTLALTLSTLAGLVALAVLLARHGMRVTARFLFTPGADEEGMAPIVPNPVADAPRAGRHSPHGRTTEEKG